MVEMARRQPACKPAFKGGQGILWGARGRKSVDNTLVGMADPSQVCVLVSFCLSISSTQEKVGPLNLCC